VVQVVGGTVIKLNLWVFDEVFGAGMVPKVEGCIVELIGVSEVGVGCDVLFIASQWFLR